MRRVKAGNLHPAYQIARAISQHYGDSEDIQRVDDPDSVYHNMITEPDPSLLMVHTRIYEVEYQSDIDDRYDVLIYDPSDGLPGHDITGEVEIIWDDEAGMTTGFYLPEDNGVETYPHYVVFQSKYPMATFRKGKDLNINVRFKQNSTDWYNLYNIQFREQIDLTGDPLTTCNKIAYGQGTDLTGEDPDMSTVIGFDLGPSTYASLPDEIKQTMPYITREGADPWARCSIDGEAPTEHIYNPIIQHDAYLPLDTWTLLDIAYHNNILFINSKFIDGDGNLILLRNEHFVLSDEQVDSLDGTPLYFCVSQRGAERQEDRGVNQIGTIFIIGEF